MYFNITKNKIQPLNSYLATYPPQPPEKSAIFQGTRFSFIVTHPPLSPFPCKGRGSVSKGGGFAPSLKSLFLLKRL